MKLSKQATAIKKELQSYYPDSPLLDVLADSVARYDEAQDIVNDEGLTSNGKPHPLLNQLRAIAQTITMAVKILGPKAEMPEVIEDKIAALNAKRPAKGRLESR